MKKKLIAMQITPRPLATVNVAGKLIEFKRPQIMGIVNVTPDSFYDKSRCVTTSEVEQRVLAMFRAGADMIDIGGCSTRPDSESVNADEEYKRVATGLEATRKVWPEAIISLDTFRASVARRAIEEFGVGIINDIGGGTLDPEIWDVVAENRVAYVLMHMKGTPATMNGQNDYTDVLADVIKDLIFKADELKNMGIADIIIDPGFGFAKDVGQNFELLAGLDLLRATGYPVLAGLSRKRMVYEPLGLQPADAIYGTVVLNTLALLQGADILRVHDVEAANHAVEMVEMFKQAQENIKKI